MSDGFSGFPHIQDFGDPPHIPRAGTSIHISFSVVCELKYFETDIFFLIIILLYSIIFSLKWWTSILIYIIPTYAGLSRCPALYFQRSLCSLTKEMLECSLKYLNGLGSFFFSSLQSYLFTFKFAVSCTLFNNYTFISQTFLFSLNNLRPV